MILVAGRMGIRMLKDTHPPDNRNHSATYMLIVSHIKNQQDLGDIAFELTAVRSAKHMRSRQQKQFPFWSCR